jgi:hypothetical protein
MTIPYVLLCIAILAILVLIALKMGLSKEGGGGGVDPDKGRMIHGSGIYSVVRGSPRNDLAAVRPGEENLRGYLASVGEDLFGTPLSDNDRETLIGHWKAQTEANLRAIESGDRDGVSFYYYDFPKECPVCASFITKGNFVTREEIFKNPQIIPPLHLGCNCVLVAHSGKENLRETTAVGMRPFFEDETPPPLPDWACVLLNPAGGRK